VTGRDRLWAPLAGLLAGIAGGLFGVGGGAVMIPILTARFGFTQHQAHGTSLAAIGFTAVVSLVIYATHSSVAWGTAALIGIASIVTAPIGARLAQRLSSRNLARAFAVFLILVGIRLLWNPPGETARLGSGAAVIGFDLGLGLVTGLISGFMGVGGGIIVVPALVLLAGMTQQLAQGTSLAVILFAAPAGAIEHMRQGNVIKRVVPGLAIGAAIGGPLAALLALHLPRLTLTRAFAVFLMAQAVLALLRSRKPVPTPAA
jgi:uncharacterized membrane protein YfcA